MKSNSFISFVTALVIGLTIGAGVIGLLWHYNLKPNKIQPPLPLTSTGHFWRMTIFRSQYDHMKSITSVPHLDAFRLTPIPMLGGKYSVLIDGLDNTAGVIPNTSKETDMGTYQPNFVRIYLTMEQYRAIDHIANDPGIPVTVAGFRLTPGNNPDLSECIWVGGVDKNGDDIPNTNIKTTQVEPCPPNCDNY